MIARITTTSALLLQILLTSSTSAFPTNTRQVSTIQWSRCPQNVSSTIYCGTVTVPLDYTSPDSGETLDLKLVKINATQQPSKGSILYNPGGPGIGGRASIAGFEGEALQLITGGEFDIVSWDPRGTGDTLPFSCFESAAGRANLNLKTPAALSPSDPDLEMVWSAKTMLSKSCATMAADVGELIGTAFTARDVMQIVDALGEDGLLRFWGISYGTVLGATVAAMFPDRIDRMVLDSVVNIHEWYTGRDTQQLAASEATLAGFVTACQASPDLCPLAGLDTSTRSLHQQVSDLFETLRYNPIALGNEPVSGYVDLALMRPVLLQALYNPVALWPSTAATLEAIISRNYTSYIESLAVFEPSSAPTFPNEAGTENVQGIRCSDVSLRTDDFSEVLPYVEELYDQSAHFGMHFAAIQPMSCAQWPFAAKERYGGDFNVRTRHPVLFMGNTFDPVVPLDSARNASASFEDSVVLVQDGYGHSTLAQPSVCSAKALRTYFSQGTLPPPNTICEVDVPLFTDQTYLDNLASNLTKRSYFHEQSDDERLLAALKLLSKGMAQRAAFM